MPSFADSSSTRSRRQAPSRSISSSARTGRSATRSWEGGKPPSCRPGVRVPLASPEDTILSKLEWANKAGRSEKQIDDAAGVLAVNPGLDRRYVDKWARELGVLDLWREIAGKGPGVGV